MHVRWILALPLAAAAIAAGLCLHSAAREQAVEPPVEPPAPEEHLQAEHEAEALELDGTVIPVREQSLPEASSAFVEPQIEAQSPPVVLHGTLLDANTRLPLPEFELEFEVAGAGDGVQQRTRARTDERGRFACETPILVARCVVRFVDDPLSHRREAVVQTLELEDVRKGELALEVAWGPTYRLAFAPKERIEPSGVELRLRTAGGRGRNSNATEWEAVRPAETPWVRFGPIAKDAPKIEKLAARTRDGLWAGEAEASTMRGIAPGVTLVSFEERAVLEGTVRDGEKKTVADVDIVLEAKDASEQPLKRSARTGEDGHFRFEQLPACMGQLRAASVRHAPWVQGVTLLVGHVQTAEVVLEPLAVAGAIGVRVESESGRYTPPFTLVLTLEDDAAAAAGGERFARRVRANWEEESGREVARFLFRDLPKQSFRVQVQKDDFFAWDPPALALQPPAEDARIVIRDGIPNASLCFRVKDAQTGEAIPGFELTLEFPGSKLGPRRQGARSDQAFLDHLPLDRKLAWRVEAGGHEPQLGDLAAFQVLERRDDGELRVCELELHPGWGETYRFVDARNRTPLKGVQVLLDGREAGTSGPGGRVSVRATAQPGRIEYKADDLSIAARPLRAERRAGCVSDVLVAPAKPQKGKH